jgi:hypothetical protein
MGTFLVHSNRRHYMIDSIRSKTPLMEQTPNLIRGQSTAMPLRVCHDSLRQGLLIDHLQDIGDYLLGQTAMNSLFL